MFIEPPEAPDIDPQSTEGEIVELAQAAMAGAESIGQITVLQGTVTITRASGDRVAGRFRAEVVHLLDLKKRATVSGTFDAEPGEVDPGDIDSDV